MKQQTFSETHNRIVQLLKDNGINDLSGGIQLFSDQYDKDWSISINYNGTKLKISKSLVDPNELVDDEQIKLYRSWTYKF